MLFVCPAEQAGEIDAGARAEQDDEADCGKQDELLLAEFLAGLLPAALGALGTFPAAPGPFGTFRAVAFGFFFRCRIRFISHETEPRRMSVSKNQSFERFFRTAANLTNMKLHNQQINIHSSNNFLTPAFPITCSPTK